MNRSEWQPSPSLWRKLQPLARQMRNEPTAAENKLWQRIRRDQIREVKFRRQYAIERFVADFCALSIHLIIEVDGPTHEYTQEEDQIRQELLESAGFAVLRFTNLDVLNNMRGVLERIDEVVRERLGEERIAAQGKDSLANGTPPQPSPNEGGSGDAAQ